MVRLFISYTQGATGEYALACALEARLRERGVEIFRDETSVAPGKQWKDVLHDRLTVWATHVLFIVSDAAWSSEYVRHEILVAEERIATRHDLQVLWLSYNRETGLPPAHWLNDIQSLRVKGKQPPHISENEWIAAVEVGLGLRFGMPGLSAAFADYIEKKTTGFVGREHIFATLRNFFESRNSGYISLIGAPGMGKTAILCELTKRERAVAHFFIRTAGITRIDQMYETLGKQLHDRYDAGGLGVSGQPWSVTLGFWLAQARAKMAPDEKLIIVIDAADECDDLSARDSTENMLSLPRSLPSSVYCVLSRRVLDPNIFNIQIEAEIDVGIEELDLMKFMDENARDTETFLHAHFDAWRDHPWLTRHGQTAEQAVKLFSERSEGNFMYLRYVLPQIAEEPDEFSPSRLPKGLEGYYLGHWKRMTAKWRDDPSSPYVFEVVYLIVVDQSLRTTRQIAAILRISLQQVRPLIQQWREFLEEDSIGDETGYRIYHWSFAEFLQRQDPVIDAKASVGPLQRSASKMIQNYIFDTLFRRPVP